MITIAILGTFDTKGAEHAFIADCIRRSGHRVLLIDVGSHEPTIVPDFSREAICRWYVGRNAESQQPPISAEPIRDRGEAIAEISSMAPSFVRNLVDSGAIQGIVSLGGTGGTAIGTAVMRSLPLGFPKVMVSTVANSHGPQYLGVSDIVMIPSIVDISGLNRVSERVFARAAAAVVGMALANQATNSSIPHRPLVVASMFGNTTQCVEHARRLLEEKGFEVLVFHATGIGGRTMEALIETGDVSGVLDITTTEWADEYVGGTMRGGPTRLEAAARLGIPAVVAPGCLDMVNFGERSTIPCKFANRTFYQHNPQITLMRTTPEECRAIGQIIASKLNASIGPVRVLFPMRGISVISREGQPFYDPVADEALFESWSDSLRSDIPVDKLDCDINDRQFAQRCVEELLEAMQNGLHTMQSGSQP